MCMISNIGLNEVKYLAKNGLLDLFSREVDNRTNINFFCDEWMSKEQLNLDQYNKLK